MTACKSNCKNLATALEMYAKDNQGLYCMNLTQVTEGNYLKSLPTCPSAGKDTYSSNYRVHTLPARYTFYCEGLHHSKAFTGFPGKKDNFPQYSAEGGLVDHP